MCRVFKSLRTPTTDTDDTDDEWSVGGQGFYSHGAKCLTHQHLVDQVVSAGGFNVHDVQGPEAAHKVNMHLPSARVRHQTSNETQNSMLRYTCNHILFEELKHRLGLNTSIRADKTKRAGLRLPLGIQHFSGTNPVRLNARTKNTFLGREVRVTVLEFMEMLCLAFGLPRDSPASYQRLKTLNVTFGQSYVREDELTLFGTDSRRDIVSLLGLHDGNHLCCEIVCFIRLNNLRDVLNNVWQSQDDRSSTYALVRWLEPHPDAWERDVSRRPVSPGPLHINNCLWRYALTDSPRDPLVNPACFRAQRNMFGTTTTQQDKCRRQEMFTYYGLVTPKSIMKIENMCPLFERDTASHNCMSWLQSVVMM